MVSLSRTKKALLLAISIHLILMGGIFASWFDLSKKNQDRSETIMVMRLNNIVYTDSEKSSVFSTPKHLQYSERNRIQSKKEPVHHQYLSEPFPKPEITTENDTVVVIPSEKIETLIQRHYGELFEGLSKEEKLYIIENIVTIHRIDRKIGNALLADQPRNAFRDGESNFVEMYLHPDGTISDITIIDDGDHPELDKLTMETVERSYSSYPLPKQVTLIRLHTKIYKAK